MSSMDQLLDVMFRDLMTKGKTTLAARVINTPRPQEMYYEDVLLRTCVSFGGIRHDVRGKTGTLWMFPDNSGLFMVPPVERNQPWLLTYAGDDISRDHVRIEAVAEKLAE